ncbi:MAG: hypothetical protein B7733_19195 [Myxococcales bacterium FL481]|nr:MAG: hypothetical protein B7733_19195 [Myxococcales bacterium FL481]
MLRSRRRVRLLGWMRLVAVAVCLPWPGVAQARRPIKLDQAMAIVRDVETVVVGMERAAAADRTVGDDELARRLVEGQLTLAEADYERAAIQLLELVEHYPERPAGQQALYYLGEALTHLRMHKWAAECLSRLLSSTSQEAISLRHRALARLLDLAAPRRPAGFAREPGMSATPEIRARLEALGVSTDVQPPAGVFRDDDLQRLTTWVGSIPAEQRDLELQYAFGRFLYLRGDAAAARTELDEMWPPDGPGPKQVELARYWTRAGYIAAAAALALDDHEEAIARFERVASHRSATPRDTEITQLATLALGRIYHDLGEPERAVAAYRQISRSSSFFPEAMYETAWTQLRAGRFDSALQTLDVLLVVVPDNPIVPEIKQLRGKLKIQQRQWKAAEEEFIALRREFAELSQALAQHLRAQGEAARYFAAVAVQEAEHFSLTSVIPPEAVPMATRLSFARRAETAAVDLGTLQRDIDDARGLLARMEEAVSARQRARLFNDLGGFVAAIDTAALELVELQERLIERAQSRARRTKIPAELGRAQRRLRARLDDPTVANDTREVIEARLEEVSEAVHRYDLMIAGLHAQLVASEDYYDRTFDRQRISNEGFLNQASELREAVAQLEQRAQQLEAEARRLRTALRFSDPWHDARARVLVEYRGVLAQIFAVVSKAEPETEGAALYRRIEALHERIVAGYPRLDRAAEKRLREAIRVLEEERGNLEAYRAELGQLRDPGAELVGEVLEASYRDVVAEAENMATRSEVGLLDVAWAIQEVEAAEIRRLEGNRARDLEELERVLTQGLEELR